MGAADHTARDGATDGAFHLRARVLPGGQVEDLWVHRGRVGRRAVEGARTIVSGGWVLPALVDAHLHVGVREIGGRLDREVLEEDLRALARGGIGAARVLGSPEPLPAETLRRPGGPLLLTAGVAVAAPGRFIPGWGHLADGDGLPSACVAEAGDGWAKIVADWFDDTGGYGPSYEETDLAAAVSAVHSRGGQVAAHTQSDVGGRRSVAAGVDTIEHGMHLPFDVLPVLAARSGVLVPTGTVFEQLAPSMVGDDVPVALRDWFAEGVGRHRELVQRALDAGVTVLAGTDLPVGALVDEVRWLHEAGMSATDAIGAASWTARDVLDLPRLREGDRADLVWYDRDPREDLELLRAPDLVVLGGAVVGA